MELPRVEPSRVGQVARAAILAVLLGLFCRTFLVEMFEIESPSMSPALLPGDHILVNGFLYAGHGESVVLPQRRPRRGDVVVLQRPGGEVLVKRVVALPGEVLEIRDGQIFVQGALFSGSGYGSGAGAGNIPERIAPIRLRSREIYVLGDHRRNSRDSRHWGPAKLEWLRGRALLIYWSSALTETGRDWDKMDRSAWQRVRSTRWDRWLSPVR